MINSWPFHSLIAVGQAAHPAHDTENIVVSGVYANLSGLFSSDGFVGKDELKGGVVNTREVASARWLMFLRAKSKRVHVDTSVRIACVVLVRLDSVEVGSLALRETVLTVKLEFGSDNRVFAPAMKVKGRFGKNE